jgi:hypothetical protein
MFYAVGFVKARADGTQGNRFRLTEASAEKM